MGRPFFLGQSPRLLLEVTCHVIPPRTLTYLEFHIVIYTVAGIYW